MAQHQTIEMNRWKQRRFLKRKRYYELRLQQDLWGHWEIAKIYGRQNTARAKIQFEVFNSRNEAAIRLEDLSSYRINERHYAEVNGRE